MNSFLRAEKRRLAILVLVLALGAVVIGAHSGINDSHGEGHLAETAAGCLAIFMGAGLFVATGGAVRRPWWRPNGSPATRRAIPSPPVVLPRAGPLILQVFRL